MSYVTDGNRLLCTHMYNNIEIVLKNTHVIVNSIVKRVNILPDETFALIKKIHAKNLDILTNHMYEIPIPEYDGIFTLFLYIHDILEKETKLIAMFKLDEKLSQESIDCILNIENYQDKENILVFAMKQFQDVLNILNVLIKSFI